MFYFYFHLQQIKLPFPKKYNQGAQYKLKTIQIANYIRGKGEYPNPDHKHLPLLDLHS